MALKSLTRTILTREILAINYMPVAGLQSVVPTKVNTEHEMPEKPRLKVVSKTPVQMYPSNVRPFKLQKKLKLMRGPETIHNFLMHEQYGIMAESGGRMKFEHFEMIRMSLIKMIDFTRAFAVWRIDPPWQPLTKKAQGMRMGGGKGSIHCYATPVKARRIIVEIAGPCEYYEVQYALENIASRLPFKAKAVSQELLEKEREIEKQKRENNLNPFTWQYIIQNNMLGYGKSASPYERRWFNKYM